MPVELFSENYCMGCLLCYLILKMGNSCENLVRFIHSFTSLESSNKDGNPRHMFSLEKLTGICAPPLRFLNFQLSEMTHQVSE